MSYTVLAHVATGDVATAALQNALIDNLAVITTCIDTSTGSLSVPAGKALTLVGTALMTATGTTGGQNLGNCYPMLRGYQEKYQSVSIAAGVVTIDNQAGNHVSIPLNANITSFALSSAIFGITSGYVTPLVLYFTNDGTLRTVTWTINGNAVQFPSGVAPVFTGTINKVDTVVIKFLSGFLVLGEQVGYNA